MSPPLGAKRMENSRTARMPSRPSAKAPGKLARVVAGRLVVARRAAALSIPLTSASGVPLPQRDLVLVLATAVIVISLIVQGPGFLRQLACPGRRGPALGSLTGAGTPTRAGCVTARGPGRAAGRP